MNEKKKCSITFAKVHRKSGNERSIGASVNQGKRMFSQVLTVRVLENKGQAI